jgi:succinoglycan biosynthesis transport protein ExoP
MSYSCLDRKTSANYAGCTFLQFPGRSGCGGESTAMNRRVAIFVCTLVVLATAGLAYTYSITPTYVASARIQIEPGTNSDKPQESAAFVANQVQTLTSNEMYERLVSAISRKSEFWKYSSVPRLRESLSAFQLPGTNVIELQARGAERERLPELLELWAAAYIDSRGTRGTVDRELGIEDARKTVVALENRVSRKRTELDQFRRRNGIVSPEREENEVAAEMKSVTLALNDARNKAIEAESRLSTAKASMADGKPVYRAQDKASVAQMEQRLLELRQKLKDQEVNFTPQYLAMEPSVKALHANIQQLEQQIEETRRGSQQGALAEAAQDLVAAQKNVSRLQAQLAQRRDDALKFTSRFAEHKAQSNDLAQLEAQLTQAKQRLALLERNERGREPTYELLGHPAVPEKPVDPDYVLYTAGTLGLALIAGLLAVLLVEFLNPRPKPEPSFQPIIQIAYPALPGGMPSRLAGTVATLPGSAQLLPAPHATGQRELSIAEVYALWEAATSDGRLALACLFSGLTLEELAGLRWDGVDFDRESVSPDHPHHRVQPITAPLAEQLAMRRERQSHGGAVATDAAGQPYSVEDLRGLLAAAAHDARLEQSETIDADVVRHTYVAFLVRQGVRLSELELLVGPVPPASFLCYRDISPKGVGLPFTAVDRVFPTFRNA